MAKTAKTSSKKTSKAKATKKAVGDKLLKSVRGGVSKLVVRQR